MKRYQAPDGLDHAARKCVCRYGFLLVDRSSGEIAGNGWVTASSPDSARRFAECFLAGVWDVQLLAPKEAAA